MALGLLVGTGTGNRISVLLGQRDREGAERVLGQGLRLALINGVVLALVVCAFQQAALARLRMRCRGFCHGHSLHAHRGRWAHLSHRAGVYGQH